MLKTWQNEPFDVGGILYGFDEKCLFIDVGSCARSKLSMFGTLFIKHVVNFIGIFNIWVPVVYYQLCIICRW